MCTSRFPASQLERSPIERCQAAALVLGTQCRAVCANASQDEFGECGHTDTVSSHGLTVCMHCPAHSYASPSAYIGTVRPGYKTSSRRRVIPSTGSAAYVLLHRPYACSACRATGRSLTRWHVSCNFGGLLGGVNKALQKQPPIKTPVTAETPPYKLLSRTKDYELRLYDVYPYISTPYERRDEGYLALGAYMDGQNTESVQMNSTQPIVMRYEPATGLKQMQLYVGSRKGDPAAREISEHKSKPEPTLRPPVPLGNTLTLEVGGGEVVAVRLFNGQATESACMQHRLHLEKALELDGIKLSLAERSGVFRLAQYGPINSLSTRNNELMLAVQL